MHMTNLCDLVKAGLLTKIYLQCMCSSVLCIVMCGAIKIMWYKFMQLVFA